MKHTEINTHLFHVLKVIFEDLFPTESMQSCRDKLSLQKCNFTCAEVTNDMCSLYIILKTNQFLLFGAFILSLLMKNELVSLRQSHI